MSGTDRKKALITGASRGIGRAIAEELASLGYDLYLTCHKNSELLAGLSQKLWEQYRTNCQCYTFPISNEEEVSKMFAEIPYLDILVNNAGISYIGLLTDMTYNEWKTVIDTNLNACFLTCRCAVPEMLRRRRGKIINISSVWGAVGASTEVAYSASKGGINAFTRALAKELGPSNIQVNAIACGVIETDMNKCFDETEIEILRQEIPADRLGQPQEVAKLVGLLCNGRRIVSEIF